MGPRARCVAPSTIPTISKPLRVREQPYGQRLPLSSAVLDQRDADLSPLPIAEPRSRLLKPSLEGESRPGANTTAGRCPRKESNLRTRFRKPVLYP